MGRSCAVPGCKSSYKNVKNNSIFKVPNDADMLKRWEAAIPGEVTLTSSSFICKKHFEDKFVINKWVKLDEHNNVIAEVPFKHPRLDSCAIPTIFGNDGMENSIAVASIIENPVPDTDIQLTADIRATLLGNREISLQPELTNKSEKRRSDTAFDGEPAKRSRLDSPAEVLHFNIASSLVEDKSSKVTSPVQTAVPVPISKVENDRIFDFPTVIITERFIQQVDNSKVEKTCSAAVPKSWSVSKLSNESGESLLFSFARPVTKTVEDAVVIQKCITLYRDKTLRYHTYGRRVNTKEAKLVEFLDEIEGLPNILDKFERMNVCSGIGPVDVHHVQIENVFQDSLQQWHHVDCSLVSKTKRCDNCLKLRKLQLQKEARLKKNSTAQRVFSSSNPVEKEKLAAVRKRNNYERRKKNRAKMRVTMLLQSLNQKKEEISRINAESLENKCSHLNVPAAQKLALKEIVEAATKKDVKGRRYTEEWIMLCVLMNIRSPGYYEFLRKNNVLPLPCSRTIRNYFSMINMKCGFDDGFAQLLKKHFDRKPPQQRHGVLLFDEINLRKSVAVCSKNLTYVGLTDFGNDGPQSTDIDDRASHGLVIMFQSLADSFTQPIAVCASKNPVKGEELAKLAIKAIRFVEESGATIHGLIADGASTNKKMWSLLGVTSSVDETKSWFHHPLDSERKIFVFSDTPHLIKTTRNRLHNKKRLRINSEKNFVEWKYFETLFDVDSRHVGNARACPKITKRHVNPDNTSKMRVRLATQIFSNSVADGLAFYLSQNCPEFVGCEETIAFCKRMNDLFDALNRKSPNEGLTPDSKDFKVLEDSLEWLNRWELAARKGDITYDEFLTQETAQGLRITIKSTMELCRDLIENYNFRYLLTGKVNQDNLEKFFGTIRQAAGCNDHPSCPTFLQLYKLLSIYSIIKPPKYGNCTVSDETAPQILVSLNDLKAVYGEKSEAKSTKYQREVQRKLDATLEHEEWEADDIIEYRPDHDYTLSPTLDCIIYYVTGFSF